MKFILFSILLLTILSQVSSRTHSLKKHLLKNDNQVFAQETDNQQLQQQQDNQNLENTNQNNNNN